MTATKFPVFCRLRLASTVSLKSHAIDGWLDEPGKNRRSGICEKFREGGARDWIAQLVASWKLDDLSLADLSELIGISNSAVSRLRNDSSTSIGVLGQWAAINNCHLHSPNHVRWSMSGIASALQYSTWLNRTTTTRPNRTPPQQLSDSDLSLLVVLEASRLQDDWDSLTDRYESDLYQARTDAAFAEVLQRIGTGFLRLTQTFPPANRRYLSYFPNGALSDETRWQLCRDIDDLNRKLIFDGSRMWNAVCGLTPWLYGMEQEDDEQAA